MLLPYFKKLHYVKCEGRRTPLPLNINLKDARNNNLDITTIIKEDIEL